MRKEPEHLSMRVAIIVSCALLVALSGTSLFAWSNLAEAAPVDTDFVPHMMQPDPVIRDLPAGQPTNTKPGSKPVAVQYPCQSNAHAQTSLCYGPYQVRQAYGVSSLLADNFTGRNSVVTIIDAYGSSTVQHDLQAFDAQWGLPDASVHVITPFGVQGTDASWGTEVSMDVEWTHVMAPGASINLVVGKSSNDVDLFYALKYAVDHNLGDVISLSFGENESCADSKLRRAFHQILSQATQKRITVLAATGDFGSAQYTCDNASLQQAVSFPADDPLITAVGGTALSADAVSGQYNSEVGWNEADSFNKASGGGFSIFYARPSYQDGATGKTAGRAVPDLALNASINGGVLVYQSKTATNPHNVTVMGGTSVGTPELAGLVADGVQMAGHRLGQLNPALYQLGLGKNYAQTMNDISSGNNILLTSDIPGYAARPGWDAVTGWGSPKKVEPFLRALTGTTASPPPTSTPTNPPASPSPTKPPTGTLTNAPPVQPTSTPTGSSAGRTKSSAI